MSVLTVRTRRSLTSARNELTEQSGLLGPARDCSPLIPGFCEPVGNIPVRKTNQIVHAAAPGNRIQTCTQETASGGGMGDLRFSCEISVENMAATAEIHSIQLYEEVLLAINNTCGGQRCALISTRLSGGANMNHDWTVDRARRKRWGIALHTTIITAGGCA
ncbi:hypothetical protein B0H19DRAFT_1068265 [Mycena capillaripes]|nr:hypothetical protein B0H19DRAFT_1068265 [Mycena capillaripes]